jgi:putative oxygen-independent coproporphyrinogen III oxidase
MHPSIPAAIINRIAQIAHIDKNTEITLETNPTSYEAKKFLEFKTAGINRISIGIQSLNDHDLKFLGREHSSAEAIETIKSAAKIFDNYSFDLIYTRPNQTQKQWQKELTEALALAKDHLSLYQLTIEKGTKFYSMHKSGAFKMPNDEISYILYKTSNEMMELHGFNKYEVSNFARNKKESVHNLCYWEYDDYLGIGPGAHSRIKNNALYQIYQPEKWLNKALSTSNANQKSEMLDNRERFMEIILMGMRLTKGISFKKLEAKVPDYQTLLRQDKLVQLEQNKLIYLDQNGFRATESGFMKLNKLIEFLTPPIVPW